MTNPQGKSGGGASSLESDPAFFRSLVESSPEVTAVIDEGGRIRYASPAARRLLGTAAGEPVGSRFLAFVHPKDRDRVTRLVQDAGDGPALEGADEVRVARAHGGWVWMQSIARRLLDGPAAGHFLVQLRDSTPRREAEQRLRETEDQLRRAQKMEAVGQLAGGIAHDFNNLLTTIGGYAGMAAERARDHQLASDISEIMRATERARGLVDKLLAFGSRSRVSLRPVDLNQSIRDVIAAVRRSLGPGILLEAELPDDVWPVRSDPARFEQALLNLVLNASEAMPGGGLVSIRTDNVLLGPEAAARLDEPLPAGEYVRVTVQDTGAGMDAAVLGRIFEPFFTTKQVGKGTGLGLSMVFGVMRSLSGGIEVETEPGKGTRFCLYIPRSHEEVPAGAGSAASVPEATGRAARILLVEDEPAVRRLARRILERDGHEVLEAGNGTEALRRVDEGPAPDLVVTDVIMPEMGGGELANRLRAARPGLRVLFMSGYTADELEDRGIEDTAAFLSKPFPPALLLSRVRAALLLGPESDAT
jgi:two-component system cell cycle sensor histidine kinase/response regulator CckA